MTNENTREPAPIDVYLAAGDTMNLSDGRVVEALTPCTLRVYGASSIRTRLELPADSDEP